MTQIRANIFKSRCLAIMDEVQSTGEAVVVTRRGIPIVKVMPIPAATEDLFGFMAGKFEIVGDIESPIFPLRHFDKLFTRKMSRTEWAKKN
jgi:antitoxin (DNA-binding transcriptional repressor) of toxin-antitoxin stability system